MEIQTVADRLNVSLPNILDLPASSDLRQILLQVLESDEIRRICLDAAQVERVSTASLQVILAARSECVDRDKELKILAPSDAFTLAVNQIGLDSDSLTEPATKV